MSAFNDTTCPKCKRRIGWFGKLTDNPGCKCGWKPDEKYLKAAEEDEKHLEEMTKHLLEKKNANRRTTSKESGQGSLRQKPNSD